LAGKGQLGQLRDLGLTAQFGLPPAIAVNKGIMQDREKPVAEVASE
jgi:hypothetical protein